MEKEKIPTMTYTIKYIADDTGATLGISTGYAKKDEIIVRNMQFKSNLLNVKYYNSSQRNAVFL